MSLFINRLQNDVFPPAGQKKTQNQCISIIVQAETLRVLQERAVMVRNSAAWDEANSPAQGSTSLCDQSVDRFILVAEGGTAAKDCSSTEQKPSSRRRDASETRPGVKTRTAVYLFNSL